GSASVGSTIQINVTLAGGVAADISNNTIAGTLTTGTSGAAILLNLATASLSTSLITIDGNTIHSGSKIGVTIFGEAANNLYFDCANLTVSNTTIYRMSSVGLMIASDASGDCQFNNVIFDGLTIFG